MPFKLYRRKPLPGPSRIILLRFAGGILLTLSKLLPGGRQFLPALLQMKGDLRLESPGNAEKIPRFLDRLDAIGIQSS
jgi:hypothetical protein